MDNGQHRANTFLQMHDRQAQGMDEGADIGDDSSANRDGSNKSDDDCKDEDDKDSESASNSVATDGMPSSVEPSLEPTCFLALLKLPSWADEPTLKMVFADVPSLIDVKV